MDVSVLIAVFGNVTITIAVLVLIALIAVQVRTGSSHMLSYRLWRLVADKSPVPDEKIKTFLDEQMSLMSFRFMSGLRVETIEGAHRLIDWIKCRQLDVGNLRAAGRYFDSRRLAVSHDELPSGRQQTTKLGGLILVTALAAVALFGITLHSAMLRFNGSGLNFLLSHDSAQPLWPPFARAVRAADCKLPSRNASGFNPTELKILCAEWGAASTRALIDSTVAKQRGTFTVLFGILSFFGVLLFASIRRGHIARYLASQIEAADHESADLPLPAAIPLQEND